MSSGITVATNGASAYRHWPPQVPVSTPPENLLAAVRGWLSNGDDAAKTAFILNMDPKLVWQMTLTPQWLWLAAQHRDEYVVTQAPKYQRLENKFLAKLEDYADHGVTIFYTDKEGQPRSYQRELTPKEVISATLMLNEQNKRIDRIATGEGGKERFNQKKVLEKLEKLASKIDAKEIDGESERVE